MALIRFSIPGAASASVSLDDPANKEWARLGVRIIASRRVGRAGTAETVEATEAGARILLSQLEYRGQGSAGGWDPDGDGEARAARVAVERIRAALKTL